MMKSLIVFGILILIGAMFIYVNKLYYPKLPISTTSAKEVLQLVKESDGEMIEIGTDEHATWYIMKDGAGGMKAVDEKVIDLARVDGWNFQEKLGAGLIFKKKDDERIITTQMWTSKYVLIRVPFA